jgi:hypothetical protein
MADDDFEERIEAAKAEMRVPLCEKYRTLCVMALVTFGFAVFAAIVLVLNYAFGG